MKRLKFTSIAILAVILLGIISAVYPNNTFSQASSLALANSTSTGHENDYIYLSDLEYITTNNMTDCAQYNLCSKPGYDQIRIDKNINGGQISLLVGGEKVSFKKGIFVHAQGQIVYNLEEYSSKYTRLVAKLGIDASQNGNGNARFEVWATKNDDNTGWKELSHTKDLTSKDEAVLVDVDITGYKYLKIWISSNGSNSSDHTVIADARIIREGYDTSKEVSSLLQPVEYYDELLSQNTAEENYNEHLDWILEREFVSRFGYYTIQNNMRDEGIYKDAITWLIEDDDALEILFASGNMGDSSLFLSDFIKLYQEYHSILDDPKNGDVYKKMLITIAVADSTDRIHSPLVFASSFGNNNLIELFGLMKNLYDQNLFINKDEFKNYHPSLMRFVMSSSIRNDDVLWLNGYSDYRYPGNINNRLNPYQYMSYVQPNYNQGYLYQESNRDKYDQKYLLSKYEIPYGLGVNGSKTPRTWMVMEAGGICWNISRLGQNLYKVHGIPATGGYQPAHEVYIYYQLGKDGKGYWYLGNNISGWGYTATNWGGGHTYPTLLGWGNKSFTKNNVSGQNAGYNAAYTLLAQAALNKEKEYEQSFYYNLVANSYSDLQKKASIYLEALDVLDINLESYISLIDVYKKLEKSSAEWKELALKVINSYTYYPMAMVDLLNLIYPYLEDVDIVDIDLKKNDALNKAINTTSKDNIQPNAIKEIAKRFVGEEKVPLATFSFDGENASKIVLNERYKDYNFQVQYSFDKGQTWHTSLNYIIPLSEEELSLITAANDIQVKISGSNEVYTIDILKGDNIDKNKLAIHDEENIFVGKTDYLEYSLDNIHWSNYNKDITFKDDVQVYVRYKSHGVYLTGEAGSFQFHQDSKDSQHQYISVKNISLVHAYSWEPGNGPENILDASPFTRWHTKYGVKCPDKSLVVSFDKVRYLSRISYTPDDVNGRIKDGEVYTSLDGNTWVLAATFSNWGNNYDTKVATFDAKPAKYVKIVATHTYGNNEGPDKYVSGRMVGYYEDTTKNYDEEAYVNYSIYSLTNQDVVASVVVPDGWTVKGDATHTFSENGEYTFVYTDIYQNEKRITAKVDWIDKIIPTADIVYDKNSATNYSVTATLTNISKDNVEIMNHDSDSYTFYENGEFTFKLKDAAGNIGYVTAKVDWIDNTPPTGVIVYEVQKDGSVLAKVTNLSEKVHFIGDDGTHLFTENGEYEFVFTDLAGNETRLLAVVDSIKNQNSNNEDEKNESDLEEDVVTKPEDVHSNTDNHKDESTQKPTEHISSDDPIIQDILDGKYDDFTKEDIKKIEDALKKKQNVKLYYNVKRLSTPNSDLQKKLEKEETRFQVVAGYYQINATLMIDEKPFKTLSKINNPVSQEFLLPTTISSLKEGYEREYGVYYLENGDLVYKKVTYKDGKVYFDTDALTDYVLVYQDHLKTSSKRDAKKSYTPYVIILAGSAVFLMGIGVIYSRRKMIMK